MSYSTYNPHLLDGIHRLHFIGVGGSGMYPLVQIMHKRGYQITGSDVEQTKVTPSRPWASKCSLATPPKTSAMPR